MTTRRAFLAKASLSVVGVGLAAIPRRTYAIPMTARQPVNRLIPDTVDPETLRRLARQAIEAAVAAGATYADIRVSAQRVFKFGGAPQGYDPWEGYAEFTGGFNCRVRVGAGWATVYSGDLTATTVVQAAQRAVATARAMSAVTTTPVSWAPAPVVTGEWATPIQIDPFTVSPTDQAWLATALLEAARRRHDVDSTAIFDWTSETRVFASSEGSFLTQRLHHARPSVSVEIISPLFQLHPIKLNVPSIAPCSAGFECVTGPDRQDAVCQTVDDGLHLGSLSLGELDVGRYEVVVDGTSMATLAGETLLPALELARAIGDGDRGRSWFGPIESVLDQPRWNDQLTIVSDRTVPQYGAAKWDDEGVAIDAFPLIDRGVVVNYLSTRANLGVLHDWQTKRGGERSGADGRFTSTHGAAVSWSPTHAPMGSTTAVTMVPSPTGLSLEAMVKQVQNGLVMRTLEATWGDQGSAGGLGKPLALFIVKKGQLTRRFPHDSGFVQFGAARLWSKLAQIGNASTMEGHLCKVLKLEPFAAQVQAVSAPAGHFHEIDIYDPRKS